MPSINFYFMRHGESTANQQGLIAGSDDCELTHRGKLQVAQAAYYLRGQGIHFDLIVSSPQVRSLDTAEILAEGIGYPEERIISIRGLAERRFGSYEGTANEEGVSVNDYVITSSGGESEADFMQRMELCRAELYSVASSKQAKLVLIVSHSWVYRGLGALAKGDYTPGDLASRQRLKNANITFLDKM